jgi:FecR protein/Tetratricopeptide repeat
MTRRTVPPIRPSDLRDHADSARIDRIWDRLEQDLSTRAPDKPRSVSTMFVFAAAAVVIFVAGVGVGSRMRPERGETPIHATSLDNGSAPSVLAAGRQPAKFDLPGGGTLTLSPGATVEIDRDEQKTLTLRLLRGEASAFTTSAGKSAEIALIVEDARVLARPGSEVFVRRNSSDIDVRVASGSAELVWPTGSRELSTGDRLESVPMRVLLAPVSQVDPVEDEDPRPQRTTTLPQPREMTSLPRGSETPMVTIAAPDWRSRYNAGELAQALDLLRQSPGGIDGAIVTARSAAELAAISDIARAKGGDPAAALNALTQLVDRFPSDPYAEIAAYTLGGMYEKMGQADQAQKYFERARSLKGVLAEDALCKQIRAEHRAGRKDEAKRMAKEYVNKYPDGRCKEDVEHALSGEELPHEEGDAVLDARAGGAASASSPAPPATSSSASPATP